MIYMNADDFHFIMAEENQYWIRGSLPKTLLLNDILIIISYSNHVSSCILGSSIFTYI